jgi:hypothetical protein
MDLKPIYDSEEEEKDTSSPLDEFKEFIVELWDMLKQDFRNSINFISSNKSFFTTAALLAILLQVSSLSNLGASFEKYCGSRDMRGGMRGGGEEPVILSFQDVQKAKLQEKADKKAQAAKKAKQAKIQKKVVKESGALANKMMEADRKAGPSENGSVKTKEQYQAEAENAIKKREKGKEDAAALKKGKAASIADYKTGVDEARDQEKMMKANQERISFFEGIKKKFQSTLSSGALGGPLFGRMDLIFDSVKNIFYIITIILTIVGVLSLPVLVFLIITYYVFKTMISKFIIL